MNLKILHIAAIGHHAEGIGTVLDILCREQKKLGAEVRVVSKNINRIYHDIDITTILTYRAFKDYISDWCPDVVIFHSVYHKEYLFFAKVLQKECIPYMVQMHGALSRNNYKKGHLKKMIANALFFNQFLRRAKGIIYLSKEEQSDCIVSTINKKGFIIPNGCFHALLPIDDSVPDFPLDIIYIGRIQVNHKGLDLLIEAIMDLPDAYRDRIYISIYGNEDDVDTSRFIEMAKTQSEVISYRGAIYGEDKYNRLNRSDLYIQTSRYEGMPMGVLEALSYGIPCILTTETNLGNVVEANKAGWKCSASAYSIRDAIIRAVDEYSASPAYYKSNAAELSKAYEWSNIAARSMDIFKEIIVKK